MTTTMIQSAALTVVILVSYGAHGVEAEQGAGVLELPWQDQLCCDSPVARLAAEGAATHAPGPNRSASGLPHHPRCRFRSLTAGSHPQQPSGGACLDILCRVDENWENVTCDVQWSSGAADAGVMAISLQRVPSHKDDSSVNDEAAASDNPVVCEAMDSFMCSLALDSARSFVAVVTISVLDAIAPQVSLKVPARVSAEQPSPPVNLSHVQTIKAELILQWDDPRGTALDASPLRFQVRYSSNNSHSGWMIKSTKESRLALNLKPNRNYTVQVRCSGRYNPPLWSDWSKRHHIYLDTVSYIPEKTVARPGDNVTIYCVFNDHSIGASTAAWMLNFREPLHPSQYQAVNQWVSQVTVRPSEARMYDLLQCTQGWSIPYSQIYVEGAFIDIRCETNGDIDAMDCSWKNTQWIQPVFRYRWGDLPCDEMEERDQAREKGEDTGAACPPARSRQESCTIKPLRMNCYKLWLEVGPVRSKPVYLSPIDHVKPHSPTNVKAVTRISGALLVTWEPPSLPVEGLQCQVRYSSLSTVRAQPEWKVLPPVLLPRAEVAVPDMCGAYGVQARCIHTNGIGYWSDWSDQVYSTPQNSRAPERGPDFWRTLQDDPYTNQTYVTLLFERVPALGRSYCVDGYVIRYQSSAGVVTLQRMEVVSSYSFEWNQEPVTVTVEAYNSLGSSSSNINMTLDSRPRRRCVRSFHVLVINSTCVSLSWSLMDNSSVPLFMVVQWSPQRQHDADPHKGLNGPTWARLPYSERSVYLRGDFLSPEEFGFYLQPVFADGEGEAVYATATRSDPAAYVMLLICSFLSVVLLVTLVLSQNQMKKFMWKDVPNPNKCSWAKGLDLKKAETLDPLFRAAEGLQAWPLLLPSENISKVVIVEKAMTSVLIQAPLVPLGPDAAAAPGFDSKDEPTAFMENELLARASSESLTASRPSVHALLRAEAPEARLPVASDSSAQSSVTYSTVLLSHPKADSEPLRYKDGSGSGSSDEGNFSANNSDISGSFPGGLWELDSCRGGDAEDARRSCSYNSVEELSETSEQPDDGDVKEEKELFYLGMDYPAEDEESEEEGEPGEEDTKTQLLKNLVLSTDDCCLESNPLLDPEESSEPMELLPGATRGFSPLYLPQFRTAPDARHPHDGKPHL
ncbi:leptin receptor [Betta splendens]|uniref:Leptin receptor n=1 Tax=Betta splendens TaxID=158456 RepID=A0A8M1HD64_BETSP|nr:leptin receptor [Betta splendens]